MKSVGYFLLASLVSGLALAESPVELTPHVAIPVDVPHSSCDSGVQARKYYEPCARAIRALPGVGMARTTNLSMYEVAIEFTATPEGTEAVRQLACVAQVD